MSHNFYEGTVYHKRFTPKEHSFTYPFYLLDIDLSMLEGLKKKLFSLEGFNLFSFRSKDHFGNTENFMENVRELLRKFDLSPTEKMHFITLPRVMNFVFNPISVLILFEEDHPTHLFAEVHNYNGGRVVYPVSLSMKTQNRYEGKIMKDMHVSPFLQREGEYRFMLEYGAKNMMLKVDLYEEGTKKLTAAFNGAARSFENATLLKLFARHTFITFAVVTRTIWQSLKLWRKGLTFYSPISLDKTRRY